MSFAKGMVADSSSIGVNAFIDPAMRNMPPKITWAIQRPI
jgi:hypothetical protein